MENFKSILYSVFFIGLLSFGGYWAFATIQTGGEHMDIEKFKKLERENKELKKELESLEKELLVLKPEVTEEEKDAEEITKPEVKSEIPKEATVVYKNQVLINEIQKLINDNVVMKLKSKGSRVGTIQKFFNLYNKTNNKIDNDFGANLQKVVIAFQKAQGLPQTGEVGVQSYTKMIEWLKKQG